MANSPPIKPTMRTQCVYRSDVIRLRGYWVTAPMSHTPHACRQWQNQAREAFNFAAKVMLTRQVTRATHVRNRVCPRVELILKIIIILLIIFLRFIKSKPC